MSGLFGASVGGVVLLGWVWNIPLLKSGWPGLALMQPNTAIAIGLSGWALLGLKFAKRPAWSLRLHIGIAAVVALIGLATFAEYALHVDLGIDLLFFGQQPGSIDPSSPGRMSLMSSICISLLGSALVLMNARSRLGQRVFQVFTLTTMLLTLLDLIGYAYGFRFDDLVSAYSTMALHAALTLFILSIGALAARPRLGIMRRFLADDPGGWLLRNLIPLAVILPLLLGGLRIMAEESGYFPHRFGSALLVLLMIMALSALLGWCANRLSIFAGERRLAEDALKERELWLRTTLISIGDGVIATDIEGKVTLLNPVAERLTGWSTEDAQGLPLQTVFRIVDETTRLNAENPAIRVLRTDTKASLTNHTVLIAKDGQERLIEDSASPIQKADALIGVVLVFRDITERRRQEDRLKEARSRLESTLAAGEVGTWEFDTVQNLVKADRNLANMFHIAAKDGHGPLEDFTNAIHPEDIKEVERSIQYALENSPDFASEYRLVGPDGSVRWVAARGRVERDETGRAIRLPGVAVDITAQKRAEERERQTGERLRVAIATARLGQWSVDLPTMTMSCSDTCKTNYGRLPTQSFTYEDLRDAVHINDRARVQEAVRQAIEEGVEYDVEYRITWPDGSPHWVIARGQVDRDVNGKPVSMTGMSLDITDRKHSEEALRESESRFRQIADTMPQIVWVTRPDGYHEYYNRRWSEYMGKTPEEGLGEGWHVLLHPDDLQRAIDRWNYALTTAEPYEIEYRLRSKEGEFRWFLGRALPVLDEDGEVVKWFGTCTDIEDFKRSEAERRKFELLAENSTDFVGMWDLYGAPLYANPAALRIIGLDSLEAMKHARLEDFLLPEDRAYILQDFLPRVLRDGHGKTEIRFRHFQTKAFRWMAFNAITLPGPDGKTIALATISQDVTERRQLEDNLRTLAADLSETDRRKDEFLATLAHELRNPLAPIRNGLQIMRMAGKDRHAIEESRTLMERQVAHMVRLIDDLMDVSRISRGKLELKKERVDLATVIANAIETSTPLIEASEHKLNVILPPAPIHVDADLTRLSQVFSNLLNNSAKYTEAGGEIVLEVEPASNGWVDVTIRDNGVGIPTDMLPKVFEMFTQVDHSLERAQGGLGIGLTLVRTLVEMHGGTIEVQSAGTGLGSEFSVHLPVVATPNPSAITPASNGRHTKSSASTDGHKILVVDDNIDSARTLSRLLKMLGYQARTAHDGGEAIEAAEEYRPEVILLDIGLPVMNGYDVARTIRETPWGHDVVIVALTGWGQEADRQRSKEAGIDRHLVKPVDPDVLERLLEELRPVRAKSSNYHI